MIKKFDEFTANGGEGVSQVQESAIAPKRISDAVIEADEAFWAAIAAAFPEVKSGDFDPGDANEFGKIQTKMVKLWLDANL